MVLSCDMDNPVILWRLKSEDERINLLKECCNDSYSYGAISTRMSFNEIKKEVHDPLEADNLVEALRN